MSSTRTPMQAAGLPGSRTGRIPPPPNKRTLAAVDTTTATERIPADTVEREPAAPVQTKPRPKVSDTAVRTVPLSLYLPVALAERLRKRAVEDHTSQADVVLDALDTAGERLTQLVEEHQAHHSRTIAEPNGQFVRRVRNTHREPLTSLSLRMDSRNLQVIDALARPHGTRARSMVCAVALSDYLGKG